jgi:hypothetical protein
MPMLQVDGKDIAKIDQLQAAGLLDAASVGIGHVRRLATFQRRGESIDMPMPGVTSYPIDLTLDFPEQAK